MRKIQADNRSLNILLLLITILIPKTLQIEQFTQKYLLSGKNQNYQQAIYSPQGNYILTASNEGYVHIYEKQSSNGQYSFSRQLQHSNINKVTSVTMSNDETTIVSVGLDSRIVIWTKYLSNFIEDQVIELGSFDKIYGVSFSPTGNYFVVIFGNISVYGKGFTGQYVKKTEKALGIQMKNNQKIVFSNDGTRITFDYQDKLKIMTWDNDSEQLDDFQEINHSYTVQKMAFSNEGNMIIVGCLDYFIRLYTLNHGNYELSQSISSNSYKPEDIAFSPDDKLIVYYSGKGEIKMLEYLEGKYTLVQNMEQQGVKSINFSPQGGYFLTAGLNDHLKIWEIESSIEEPTIPVDPPTPVATPPSTLPEDPNDTDYCIQISKIQLKGSVNDFKYEDQIEFQLNNDQNQYVNCGILKFDDSKDLRSYIMDMSIPCKKDQYVRATCRERDYCSDNVMTENIQCSEATSSTQILEIQLPAKQISHTKVYCNGIEYGGGSCLTLGGEENIGGEFCGDLHFSEEECNEKTIQESDAIYQIFYDIVHEKNCQLQYNVISYKCSLNKQIPSQKCKEYKDILGPNGLDSVGTIMNISTVLILLLLVIVLL